MPIFAKNSHFSGDAFHSGECPKEEFMTIKPLADRVVVKLVEAEEKTKTGIILTAASQEKPRSPRSLPLAPVALWTARRSR